MQREIPRVHPEDPLGEALRILVTTGVRHLPVVDGEGRVVGIITRSDFLKFFLRRA